MPRQEKQLHAWREPAALKPAATLMLLRDVIRPDGQADIEVLMTRRSMTASFAPGAYVFPGGGLDKADFEAAGTAILPKPCHETPVIEALAVASIREAYEELGILLANANGQSLDRDQALLDQLHACGGSLDTDALESFSHWETDRDLPRRFDVRFFVARMPEGQTAVADEKEQFAPEWINPAEGLARYERKDFFIIFPTIRTLRTLSRFQSVQAVLDYAREQAASAQGVPHFCPRAGLMNGKDSRHTADEMPFGELELVSPDGQITHELSWQSDKPVKLLKNVMRLTSPNPSMMTGPGTNTYIVGEPGAYIVIDPGPDIASHINQLAQLVGGDLKWILCTHSHPDHHPGAAHLAQLTGAKIAGRALSADSPGVKPSWVFSPDREIQTGDLFAVGNTTLRAIHTPGHASNHVCFVLQEDRLLISGDHILNGVTPVISPPDGDMSDYLRTLNDLLNEPIDFILPAHGYVLTDAKGAINKLIAHRLKREAKVLAAFENLQSGETSSLVKLVYDDVDSRLHQLAQDSLRAHLIKLVKEGKVPPSAMPKP
jgi:recombination protein RecT